MPARAYRSGLRHQDRREVNMMLRNIDCPRCGEPLWIEPAAEAVWDYLPGSVEIKALFGLMSEGVVHVWQCFSCSYFESINGRRVVTAGA